MASALEVPVDHLRNAAYRALGAVRSEEVRDGQVRVAGADFEQLTEDQQRRLNARVRGMVQAEVAKGDDGLSSPCRPASPASRSYG